MFLLDMKPQDDETNMTNVEEAVKSLQLDGLLWGACMLIFITSYIYTF